MSDLEDEEKICNSIYFFFLETKNSLPLLNEDY